MVDCEEHVIENPLSGERIVIRTSGAETGGTLLVWDLELAPGGRVPSSHSHPEQEERFSVVSGQMRFRVAGRRLTAGPGETVTVSPGTVHHFANPGSVPAHVHVETRPALDMEAMLVVGAAMAREQYAEGRKIPRLLELALFLRDYEREVASPYFPAVVRAVTRPIAWLTRRRALDAHYRGFRERDSASAS
jgi:mannose-6-phosphate isomerase-like protein (cupin superfamily)